MPPTTVRTATPVVGIVPAPPLLSLIAAARKAEEEAANRMTYDASGMGPLAAQLQDIPADLRAEIARASREEWVHGISWQPHSRHAALARDPCGETTKASRVAQPAIKTFYPIDVVAQDSCSSIGWSEHDFRGRALALLENAKYAAVEHEFWEGTVAQAAGWPNDFLTNEATVTDVTPVKGTAVTIEKGLAVIQQSLQECGFGGRGMIHLQAQTLTNLLTVHDNDPHFISKLEDGVMYDQLGNFIVPGVGYPGTGPKGAAPTPGTAWIYGTDLAYVREEDGGTIFPQSFSQAMDWGANETKEPNTIYFEAHKLAMAFADFVCHFAVLVKLT